MFGSFENLYFYLNRHHTTLSTNNRDVRVALASDFKGKIGSQQNKQKSGGAVFRGYRGNRYILLFRKAKHHIFDIVPRGLWILNPGLPF